MSRIRVGAKVPDFTIPTTGGEFRLGAPGKEKLVVYFYPRDNTPGCTLEGSDFRDLAPAFRKARTTILGVSTDTIESHRRFRDKMKFPFELGSTRTAPSPGCSASGSRKTFTGRK
jgi:thioredoxin-dependent peroxiredoxin